MSFSTKTFACLLVLLFPACVWLPFPWFLSFLYLRFFITIPPPISCNSQLLQHFSANLYFLPLARFPLFSPFPQVTSYHHNLGWHLLWLWQFPANYSYTISLSHSLYCSFDLSHVKVLAVFKGIQETEVVLGLEYYPLRFCYENAMRGHVCSHTM